MTDTKLKALVAEAVALDRDVSEKTDRLKALKAQLVAEAEGRPEEYTATDGGGASWQMQGNDGCLARVSFPSPTLKAKIDGEGKAWDKIKAIVGPAALRLFAPAVTYKLLPEFRDLATSQLPAADARKLIKLVTTESAPRVSFETKAEA
jgi:hypothetical protein